MYASNVLSAIEQIFPALDNFSVMGVQPMSLPIANVVQMAGPWLTLTTFRRISNQPKITLTVDKFMVCGQIGDYYNTTGNKITDAHYIVLADLDYLVYRYSIDDEQLAGNWSLFALPTVRSKNIQDMENLFTPTSNQLTDLVNAYFRRRKNDKLFECKWVKYDNLTDAVVYRITDTSKLINDEDVELIHV